MTEQEIRNLIATGRIVLFYKRGGWKRKRRQILTRDNYECQKCKREGGYSPAECVHHIQHIEDRPDLAYTNHNLVSLCNACHNEEHPEKLKRVEVDRKEHITPERW